MKQETKVFYMHAGSGNHGCEALVRSTCELLGQKVRLVSGKPEEDIFYEINKLCEIVPYHRVTQNRLLHAVLFLRKILFRDKDCYAKYQYQEILRPNVYPLCLSIGGDNYCYEDMLTELLSVNRQLRKQGSKTVLWGCSIEPEILKRREVREDLQGYRLILARESITYQALCEAGLGEISVLCPDPAFLLQTQSKIYEPEFSKNGVVGINLSPLIMKSESHPGVTMENYRELLRYILEDTKMSIALIPHVVWDGNDDRVPMQELFDEFAIKQIKKMTDSVADKQETMEKADETKRIRIIKDCNCMELKGYIAACDLFIGARTHATIAAYSSHVPTLVVGYSVKARGIAQDLFGTFENYVLPVQELEEKEDLSKAFRWLEQNQTQIHDHLIRTMPDYKKKAESARNYLDEIREIET